MDITLYKGAGKAKPDERLLWNIRRTGRLASFLGKCIHRNGYVVEQLSTFPSMVRAIRRKRPDIIFYSDSNLGFQLFRWRKQIGVPFCLLFSNGGPCSPPFPKTDFVHQVAPFYYDAAISAGEVPERHFMVPYGIRVPNQPPIREIDSLRSLRKKLRLPLVRSVILSVGWISREHKRMDYVIEELAKLPPPRPFLQLLGAMDGGSKEIIDLGNRLLGQDNFAAASIPYEQVVDYYRAADIFVLASLREGFGRVYLEAMMHGLPVVAHRHPVIEFVVGKEGVLADLSKPGELTALLSGENTLKATVEERERRWRNVRDRFGWDVLASQYRSMFEACCSVSRLSASALRS